MFTRANTYVCIHIHKIILLSPPLFTPFFYYCFILCFFVAIIHVYCSLLPLTLRTKLNYKQYNKRMKTTSPSTFHQFHTNNYHFSAVLCELLLLLLLLLSHNFLIFLHWLYESILSLHWQFFFLFVSTPKIC